MRKLDEQEKAILAALIKAPRLSDNKISKQTGIPLKTVNTKRKKLEEEGTLHYFVSVNNSPTGTGLFTARQMYKITLREGITREILLKIMDNFNNIHTIRKHLLISFLGEEHGHVILFCILESYKESDIIEIYNAEIIPFLHHHFGEHCIAKTEVTILRDPLVLLHNYFLSPSSKMRENPFVYEE